MKGIVFTEFIEMVDTKFGYDMTEKIIDDANVEGVYTSIGTYPHSEMINLVSALSNASGVEVPTLLETFGEYMFNSFWKLYPSFFEHIKDPLVFLENVESYIHREVKKIYPNAELPEIKTERINDYSLHMVYSSDRRMGDLAVGLMRGCFSHYECNGNIQLLDSKENGRVMKFLVEILR